MTLTRLKPIPGYGGALDDLNQIPVLNIADRVRRDILLPVLGGRNNSRFMRSTNGSSLIDKSPAALTLLQTFVYVAAPIGSIGSRTFDTTGKIVGIKVTGVGFIGDYLKIVTPANKAVKNVSFNDPIFWFPLKGKKLYYTMGGAMVDFVEFNLYQFG